METDLSVVKEVKRRHRFDILLKPTVTGVGIGYKLDRAHKYPPKTPCITVIVLSKLPPAELAPAERIAPTIENCLTDVIEAAPKRMRFTPPSNGRAERIRPVPGGVSGGHHDIGLGTLSGWVRDVDTGQPLLLSTWHVLTNFGGGKRGDDIIQPARLDGGKRPDDTVAYLERWIEPVFLGPTTGEAKSNLKFLAASGRAETCLNTVDAAVARPVGEEMVDWTTLGMPGFEGVAKEQELGSEIVMSGRAGVHEGFTLLTDLDILVQEGPRGIALFTECTCDYFPTSRFFGYGCSLQTLMDLLRLKP